MKEFKKWQKEYCERNCIFGDVLSLGRCKECWVPMKQEEGWRAALEMIRVKIISEKLWEVADIDSLIEKELEE